MEDFVSPPLSSETTFLLMTSMVKITCKYTPDTNNFKTKSSIHCIILSLYRVKEFFPHIPYLLDYFFVILAVKVFLEFYNGSTIV